jgi:cytochrome c-type biogenesis protein CcmF
MIAETGHFALILALVLALYQAAVPLIGAARGDRTMMMTAVPVAQVKFGFVLVAFACLMVAFVTSDFSVQNVYANSHTLKPLIYKISGVWGNHEGSMVLWVLILTFFGACVATFGGNLPAGLKARTLSVQAMISAAFLAFIVFTSNPFLRLDPAPFEGRGLNPSLQDPALAVHPPLLYAGYVGFSMAFSFAVAALIEGRVDPAWARWVRPWTLAAWMLLTIGIAMGSWWAYYELGWGGWWFWDPVENASFMPWLAGTALLHSAIVVEKRDALKTWTILLAILAFSLSLVGTFLVRSGVLTSVHAFAVDPERGVFILAILTVFIGGALTLYASRAPQLKGGGLFAPISREAGLVVNNLLITTALATVFVGTLYPLALEAVTGSKISVGAPFFNATFTPLFIPLLMVLPFGPLLAWKRADLGAVGQRLAVAGGLAVLAMIAVLALYQRGPVLAIFGIGLGVWLVAGAASEIAYRIKLFREPLGTSLRRAIHLPRSAWGTMVAHAGVGIVVLGITGVSAWRAETVVAIKPGEQLTVAGYRIEFLTVTPRQGPNYRDTVGTFKAYRGKTPIAELKSAKRIYTASRQNTTEAGIHTFWTGDLYVVLGDKQKGSGAYAVRAYHNPLVPLIWIGAFIMFLGGFISLTDRRFRIGAPKRARTRARGAAA